jgi:ABC-type uncharacterized transport system substrate-binding protein
MRKETAEAATALGVQLQLVEVRKPDEFERAFSDIAQTRADALLEFPSPMFFVERKRIVDLAAVHRLPAMYNAREFVQLGGLIAYGANILDLNRRTVVYADKILRGANPADLPVEQPTKFELAINRKTAGCACHQRSANLARHRRRGDRVRLLELPPSGHGDGGRTFATRRRRLIRIQDRLPHTSRIP